MHLIAPISTTTRRINDGSHITILYVVDASPPQCLSLCSFSNIVAHVSVGLFCGMAARLTYLFGILINKNLLIARTLTRSLVPLYIGISSGRLVCPWLEPSGLRWLIMAPNWGRIITEY